MIMMEPLAKWCHADFIQKRVKEVKASENKLIMEDDSEVEYDVLALNVGSRTRGSTTVPGVWENSLTTRPINELLGKI
jgi:NADH dehydrogenase FAD-containing subunit